MRKSTFVSCLFVFFCFSLYPQGILIKGKVTAKEDASPIMGVSVQAKGTTLGTITDSLGLYSLSLVGVVESLVFSYVGLETREVLIEGRAIMDVQLQVQEVAIDELLVIAYGTAEKNSFTGSAENVSRDKIENIQATSVSNILEGTTPGVQVTSASGQPGSEVAIRIRGTGSFYASNRPLMVLDGVPYTGHWNHINPDDIESITVLKDAASGALYGARGANGVIVVTTKRGESGKLKLNLKVRQSWSDRAIPEYPRINQKDYYEKCWETYRNSIHPHSGSKNLRWHLKGCN